MSHGWMENWLGIPYHRKEYRACFVYTLNGEWKVKKEDSGREGGKQDFGLNEKRASGRSATHSFS